MNMKQQKYVFYAMAAFLAVAPGLALAATPQVQHDLDVQRAQHARTQGAIAAQKEQAQDVREDTNALKAQREKCEHASGAALAACERQVQADKAEKRSDVAAFKAEKAIHQSDAAILKADHQKTKADKRL